LCPSFLDYSRYRWPSKPAIKELAGITCWYNLISVITNRPDRVNGL
jgi:hypothetical protein